MHKIRVRKTYAFKKRLTVKQREDYAQILQHQLVSSAAIIIKNFIQK